MRRLPANLIAFALTLGCLLAACTRVDGPSASGRHPWTQPGHVRIGATEEPDSLNPLFANAAAADQVGTLLYAYVFRLDPKGELIPEIATEVPTYANGGISKDNKTIRLHLRRGMMWADGAPLDGRDIRFTWRAVMNDANRTKSRIYWDNVAAMDLPDNNTLVVHLKRPNSAILYGLFSTGGAAYPPLPEHLLGKLPDINRAPFNSAPLSSGPWILKAWNHGSSLEFVPNDKYWRGPPKLAALSWNVVPNTDTLFAQLQTHEIDVYDPVPEAQISRVQKLTGIRLVKRLKSNWRHLEINTRKPYLSDVRVRRAIAEAVDWDRMNAKIYHGVNIRATSDIVPDSWAAPTIPQWRFDLEDAKRLLTAAGWQVARNGYRFKDGMPLAISISTGTNKPANIAAEVQMQQDLRAAGINLSIQNYAVSLLFAQNGPLYSGRYDMSWSIDTNGPEPDNQGSWSGAFIPPHGANTSFLNDPVLTQTTAQALLTFDRKKRKALYQREEERIHELVPAIFLYWSVDTAAVNSDLKNYRPAEYDMADLWNSYEWTI
jgi:peptide/nickel transport system substrate-binding protein